MLSFVLRVMHIMLNRRAALNLANARWASVSDCKGAPFLPPKTKKIKGIRSVTVETMERRWNKRLSFFRSL